MILKNIATVVNIDLTVYIIFFRDCNKERFNLRADKIIVIHNRNFNHIIHTTTIHPYKIATIIPQKRIICKRFSINYAIFFAFVV